MQIKRHIEPLDHGPERPILRQVVIDDVVRTAPLRETVDQRAAKAKVLDATLELARGAVRILHRQRRQSLEAIGPLRHLIGEIIIGLAGHLGRALFIRDRLHRRCIERQQHQLDPVLIHFTQAAFMNVHDAAFDFLPYPIGKIAVGIFQRVRNREMLLKRDLALHGPSLAFPKSRLCARLLSAEPLATKLALAARGGSPYIAGCTMPRGDESGRPARERSLQCPLRR